MSKYGVIVALAVAVMLPAGGAAAPARVAQAPQNLVRPTITGLRVGQTLVANPGTWASIGTLTYYYQWVRSNGEGGWTPIAGAVYPTYTVTADDVGYQIFLQMKAVDSEGGGNFANSYTTSFVTDPTLVGATRLADGELSVSVSTLSLPDRLIIKGFSFAPKVIQAGDTVTASIQITDSRGDPVNGALVSVTGLPFNTLVSSAPQVTDINGVATLQLTGKASLAHVPGGAVAVFVRTYAPGGSPLSGVSAAQLVKLPLAR
jgi:hypothetical protein